MYEIMMMTYIDLRPCKCSSSGSGREPCVLGSCGDGMNVACGMEKLNLLCLNDQ